MMNNLQSTKLIKIVFHKQFIYIFISVLIVLSFFKFNNFLSAGHEQKNIYDFFLFTFNDFFHLFYLLSLMSLVLVYPLSSFSAFHQYLVLRYRNRTQWFFICIVTIAILVFLFVLVIALINFLQSILTLSFENQWSKYGLSEYNPSNNDKPLTIVLGNVILVYLYLLTLSLIFFITNLFIRNSILSFIVALGFNVSSIIIYLSRLSFLYPVGFTYHALILDEAKNNFYEHIFYSIFYWILLILILLLSGFLGIRKTDMHGRGK